MLVGSGQCAVEIRKERKNVVVNFLILFEITVITTHILRLGFEYRPPCGAGIFYTALASFFISLGFILVQRDILVFDWKPFVLGLGTYIAGCLLIYAFCELVDKLKEKRKNN